jgi:hypothetical protein
MLRILVPLFALATGPLTQTFLPPNPSSHLEAVTGSGYGTKMFARDANPQRASVDRQPAGLTAPSGQAPPCQTPAARQFCAWLKAFNSGKPETLRAFFEKNFPERLANLDQELALQRVTGGFTFEKVEVERPEQFTALIQERKTGVHVRCLFEVQPHAPYRISRMDLKAVPSTPA